MDIEQGKTYEVTCPFIRDKYYGFDAEGPFEDITWRPGVEFEMYGDHGQAVAHGEGKVTYRVVSVHEPPRPYHARVFYVRQWIDPDGKQFGKTNLHIMGIQAFRRRIAMYKYAGWDECGYELRPAPALGSESPGLGSGQQD